MDVIPQFGNLMVKMHPTTVLQTAVAAEAAVVEMAVMVDLVSLLFDIQLLDK